MSKRKRYGVPRIAETDDPTVLRNVPSEFADSDGTDAGAGNDGVSPPVSLKRLSGDEESAG
jgi:hypothetical protein